MTDEIEAVARQIAYEEHGNPELWKQYVFTARAAIAALDAVRGKATHRHRKGGLYARIGAAEVQCDRDRALTEWELVEVYRAVDGENAGDLYVRPRSEFHDRFMPLPPAPEDKP